MGQLFATIGVARSGKSTVASNWLHKRFDFDKNGRIIEHQLDPTPRVIVNADKIRLSMGHRYNTFVENYVHAVADTMTRSLLYDHDVLSDETCTTVRSIKRLLMIDPQTSFHYLGTPIELCILRAHQTDQSDLEPVIERMKNNLERMCNCEYEEVPFRIIEVINKLRMEVESERENFERIVD